MPKLFHLRSSILHTSKTRKPLTDAEACASHVCPSLVCLKRYSKWPSLLPLRRQLDWLFYFFPPVITLEATQYNRYKGSIYLVFDFCEHDLAGLLSNTNVKFTLAEIKKVMQMLLNGLYYIHRNKVRNGCRWSRALYIFEILKEEKFMWEL